MACLVVTVQVAGLVLHWLAGGPGQINSLSIAEAARRRGDRVLRDQHGHGRDRDRALDPKQPAAEGLARELPVERAQLLRRRRRRGARRRGSSACRILRGVGGWRWRRAAALSHLPQPTRSISGAVDDDSASVRKMADLHLATDRGARARDRREGPDVAARTSAASSSTPRALARGLGMTENDIQGREDRRAPARHRQARGAGAHPVEARAADARGVPEDPRASEGRRRHHQARAVSVSCRAAHPEPPRAVDGKALSGADSRARKSHWARAFSRSSTTSTR